MQNYVIATNLEEIEVSENVKNAYIAAVQAANLPSDVKAKLLHSDTIFQIPDRN